MKVIRHTVDTDEKKIVDYPAIWGNAIQGLSDNIRYYEIVRLKPPNYNMYQFDIKPKIILTEDMGEFLLIANIGYETIEKSESEVLRTLDTNLGEYLDNEYPLWQRTKHLKEATILELKVGEANFTQEQRERYDFLVSLSDWLEKCRADRDTYEMIYKTTGTLPELNYDSKPMQ